MQILRYFLVLLYLAAFIKVPAATDLKEYCVESSIEVDGFSDIEESKKQPCALCLPNFLPTLLLPNQVQRQEYKLSIQIHSYDQISSRAPPSLS